MELSDELPESDPAAFSDWLTTEIGQFELLLRGALDISTYGAAIGLSRTLQELGCDHLKTVGQPSHKFLKLDSVHDAVHDNVCKNAVSRLLLRFWRKGGWALATSIGAAGTLEVMFCCCASFVFSWACSFDLVVI